MNNFESAKNYIAESDAILITASNGLSIAEGYHIFADNADFKKYFGDFRDKYGIPNLISGICGKFFRQQLFHPHHERGHAFSAQRI